MQQAAGPGRTGTPIGVAEDTHHALSDLIVLARRVVASCDAAGISLVADAGFTTAAASHRLVHDIDGAQYRSGDGPCVCAIRTGRVTTVADFAVDRRWPAVAREALAVGVRSVLSVPLAGDGGPIGAMNMYAEATDGFDGAAVEVAGTLARHAAIALRYLQRYQDERDERYRLGAVAETLQRAMLPSVRSCPRATAVARYLPAAEGMSVGGDWYDLFTLPDGVLGVAVGDVMGHGVEAAAAMGQLRSVLRSYAFEGSSPGTVLDRMDRLVQGFDMAQLATAVYGRLVLDDAGAMFLFSNAGHLPPLVRRADGSVVWADRGRSSLIGVPVSDPWRRSEAALHLENGDTLFLFTDGLVEGRRRDLDRGLERLAEVVAALPAARTPDEWCDAIVTELGGQDSDDDIALLAVQVHAAAPPPTSTAAPEATSPW